LRPMDPQPPFRMAVHCVDTDFSLAAALGETRRLTSFAGQNQILISQETKALMEAQGLTSRYSFQTVGVYALEDGRQVEMYRLISRKRDSE
jgi:hypothetical protein